MPAPQAVLTLVENFERNLDSYRNGQYNETQVKGYLPMDDSLNRHSHKLQARRQEILTSIAGYKWQQQMPLDLLKAKNINTFTKALRNKLLDRDSSFGREYLRLLVSEIRIKKTRTKLPEVMQR